jgi:hypothetical protein
MSLTADILEQVEAKKPSPLLSRARAYYRLAWKRTTSPVQARIYQKHADYLVKQDRERRDAMKKAT